jgi:hypothetical protein
MRRVLGTHSPGRVLEPDTVSAQITVKAHRGKVMRKMRVDSLADLVRIAVALDVPRENYDNRINNGEMLDLEVLADLRRKYSQSHAV